MWRNAISAAWKRLWPSDFLDFSADLRLKSEAVYGSALHTRRMQLRAETPQQAFQRLQSLRGRIKATNKFDPRRADLESQARQAVKVIFSDGVKK